jgi:hypothetical protein
MVYNFCKILLVLALIGITFAPVTARDLVWNGKQYIWRTPTYVQPYTKQFYRQYNVPYQQKQYYSPRAYSPSGSKLSKGTRK